MRDWGYVLGTMVLLIAAQGVAAEEWPETGDSQTLCLRFVRTVDDQGINTAFQMMSGNFFLPASGRTALRRRLSRQLKGVTPQYPQAKVAPTYEVVASKERGPRILRHDIVAEYERQLLLWRCIAYRVNETWLLQSINVSAALDPLFDY